MFNQPPFKGARMQNTRVNSLRNQNSTGSEGQNKRVSSNMTFFRSENSSSNTYSTSNLTSPTLFVERSQRTKTDNRDRKVEQDSLSKSVSQQTIETNHRLNAKQMRNKNDTSSQVDSINYVNLNQSSVVRPKGMFEELF